MDNKGWIIASVYLQEVVALSDVALQCRAAGEVSGPERVSTRRVREKIVCLC